MDDKFMKFWKKYGPFILFGTGITQFIIFENWAVGSIFILLGIMLNKENDYQTYTFLRFTHQVIQGPRRISWHP
jgi:hypothetical protein